MLFSNDAHLCIDEAVLGTRDKNEAIDFEEVSQFRGVEFAHTDRVALFVCAGEYSAEM